MGEALVHAVGDGAVVIQRREHFLHLVQHVFDADDIEEGFLLTGERSVRQIFGGRRRAHGERRVRVAGGHAGELGADGGFQIGGELGSLNPAADFGPRLGQGTDVLGVEGSQTGVDLFGQPPVGEELPEGVGRGCKPTRHAHAGSGELRNHFAQRGVLAADGFHVGHAKLLERRDQSGRQCRVGHQKLLK